MLDLEKFEPQRYISKLLGMGDMQGLVEHVQSLKLDHKDTMKHIAEGIFSKWLNSFIPPSHIFMSNLSNSCP